MIAKTLMVLGFVAVPLALGAGGYAYQSHEQVVTGVEAPEPISQVRCKRIEDLERLNSVQGHQREALLIVYQIEKRCNRYLGTIAVDEN